MQLGSEVAIDDFEPFRLDGPIELELSFKNYRAAEVLSYLPIVDRVDAHTVRYVADDMVAISTFIEFAMTYSPGLTP